MVISINTVFNWRITAGLKIPMSTLTVLNTDFSGRFTSVYNCIKVCERGNPGLGVHMLFTGTTN